jgi:hypothetical protein
MASRPQTLYGIADSPVGLAVRHHPFGKKWRTARLSTVPSRLYRTGLSCTAADLTVLIAFPSVIYRNDLKAARTSDAKRRGCSHAAKWPPLSSLL